MLVGPSHEIHVSQLPEKRLSGMTGIGMPKISWISLEDKYSYESLDLSG